MISQYVADSRVYAVSRLLEVSWEGRIDGGHLALLNASGMILNCYSEFADRKWPRGSTRELELLSEIGAMCIVAKRTNSNHQFLQTLMQKLLDRLHTQDFCEQLATGKELHFHKMLFSLISAAVVDSQLAHFSDQLTATESQHSNSKI